MKNTITKMQNSMHGLKTRMERTEFKKSVNKKRKQLK